MLFRCAIALSRLPLAVHYWFSDWLLFPLVYYVLRYRRRMVATNLRNAFPEKSEAERKQIARDFYHQFCDIIVEIIYAPSCSDEEKRQRLDISGMDEANRLIDAAGGGVIMFTHMGNWEWLASVQQWVSPDVTVAKVYRKLNNRRIDALMMRLREHWGGVYIEKQRVLREMVRFRAEKRKILLGLNSDQKPRPEVTRTWLTFLHQETGFLDGAEVLGKKFGYPVFYLYITRKQRGYYHVDMRTLSATPKDSAEGEITTAYARVLEQNIHEQPELWLWTHKRWKWKR